MRLRQGLWLGSEDSYFSYMESQDKIAATSLHDLHAMVQKDKAIALRSADGQLILAGEEEDGSSPRIDVRHMVSVVGDIGILHVNGTLTNEYDFYNKYMGYVSYDEISEAATLLANSPGIKAIVLDIHSPGGAATGIDKASSTLVAINNGAKPIYSFTSGMMASGGYWLGSVGKKIGASPLSSVGSIGVVSIHVSQAKMMERMGLSVTVLREGQFKYIGNSYEDLTPEVKAILQSQMGIVYDMFTEHVANQRGMSVAALKAGPGQGQVFLGLQATSTGLIDVTTDFDSFLEMVDSEVSSQSGGAGRNFLPALSRVKASEVSNMKVKKIGDSYVTLNEQGIAAVSAGLAVEDALDKPEFQAKCEDDGTLIVSAEEAEALAKVKADEEAAAKLKVDQEAAAKLAAPTSGVDVMGLVEKIQTLTQENTRLEAELTSAKLKVEQAASSGGEFKRITMSAINRMEVAMNMATSKAADYESDAAVISKFLRMESEFNSKYRVGAKAEHSVDQGKGKGDPTPMAIPTSAEKAARAATSFNGK